MLATRVLAPNSGATTLGGTNSFVVREPSSHRTVIVDPGPRDHLHRRRLMEVGEVELILLTHRHPGHSDLALRIHELTGAPVRAADRAACAGGPPLADNEVIHAAGTEIRVIATPGHTTDSVCFHLPHDRDIDGSNGGSVLTGDTILMPGTPSLDPADGSQQSYLASLQRLHALGPIAALPAHGSHIANLAMVTASRLAESTVQLRSS